MCVFGGDLDAGLIQLLKEPVDQRRLRTIAGVAKTFVRSDGIRIDSESVEENRISMGLGQQRPLG